MDREQCLLNIREILKENCDAEAVNKLESDKNLYSLEINSIAAVKIVVALEDRFDITFENDRLDISTFECLNNLADYILNKIKENE